MQLLLLIYFSLKNKNVKGLVRNIKIFKIKKSVPGNLNKTITSENDLSKLDRSPQTI